MSATDLGGPRRGRHRRASRHGTDPRTRSPGGVARRDGLEVRGAKIERDRLDARIVGFRAHRRTRRGSWRHGPRHPRSPCRGRGRRQGSGTCGACARRSRRPRYGTARRGDQGRARWPRPVRRPARRCATTPGTAGRSRSCPSASPTTPTSHRGRGSMRAGPGERDGLDDDAVGRARQPTQVASTGPPTPRGRGGATSRGTVGCRSTPGSCGRSAGRAAAVGATRQSR